MPDSLPQLIERDLRAVERKDMHAVLDCFAPDGVLCDPHYPYPEMRGHAEIRYGLTWAFAGLETLGFSPRTLLVSDDGQAAAVEVDSRHVQVGGRVLEFRQVFVASARADKIERLESYLPYGPNGIGGFFLRRSTKKYRRRHPQPAPGERTSM